MMIFLLLLLFYVDSHHPLMIEQELLVDFAALLGGLLVLHCQGLAVGPVDHAQTVLSFFSVHLLLFLKTALTVTLSTTTCKRGCLPGQVVTLA